MSMKKNIGRIVVVAVCLLGLVSVALAGQLQITHPAAGDTPPAGGTPPSNLYVAISKWKAANSGVNFAATETTQNGQVTSWLWNFANGNPSTSNQESPGVVTFSAAAAYGNSNACTVNLAHTSTDQNGRNQLCTPLTGLPIATININVVKPKLVFKTSGNWASDDTAATRASNDYHYTFCIGQPAEFYNGGTAYYGLPYEYDFTIDSPNSSGATSGDMSIYEANTFTYSYYHNATLVSTSTVSASPNPAFYNPSGYFCYTSVVAPNNPTQYACDVPSIREDYVMSNMNSYNANRVEIHATLSSHPLFQDPSGQHLDYPASQIQHFLFTCTQNSPGSATAYTWTASFD